MPNMEKDSKDNVVNIRSFFKSKEPELSLGQKKLLLLELLVPFFEIVRFSSKGIVLPARGSGDEISCPKCTQKTWSDKRPCVWCEFDISGYEAMQISLAANMLCDIDNRRWLLDKTIKRSYIYTVVPIILLLSFIFLDSIANLAAVFISILFIFIFVYLRLKLNKERASLNRYIEEQRQFIEKWTE